MIYIVHPSEMPTTPANRRVIRVPSYISPLSNPFSVRWSSTVPTPVLKAYREWFNSNIAAYGIPHYRKSPLHGLDEIAHYHGVRLCENYQPPKVEDVKFRLDAIERLLFNNRIIELASFWHPKPCPALIIKEYLESQVLGYGEIEVRNQSILC
jgi:hypothetical protein